MMVPVEFITSMSSAYCAATATPTLGLLAYQDSFRSKPQFKSIFGSTTGEAKATQTFSDPLANSTAVRLYFTPAVTGSAALDIGVFTETVKPSTTSVKDGQIVATANTAADTEMKTTSTKVVKGTQEATKAGKSTTATTGNVGARQSGAALAGVLGLLGAVALL